MRKAYHGFSSNLIIKDDFEKKNTGVNTAVLNCYETNDQVIKHVDSLNKKQEIMLFGYYLTDGIPIKKDIIEFNKFKI